VRGASDLNPCNLILSLLVTGLFLSFLSPTPSETSPVTGDTTIAFPGAEGFGKYATGGRGGRVIWVTNLNDSGPGSLREAVSAAGSRYILFSVAGTIQLKSPLEIKKADVSILGQSAPGEGICISNYNVAVKTDNVIIRYIRFRLGDEQSQQDDALTSIRNHTIIIDHCSMSWATDECASFYDNADFTLQWCIISESLNHSVHEKGDHGYGGIWGGKKASFHHNLMAHHKSRLPRFCGSRYHKHPEEELVDFSNNVIYNWMENSSYGGERGTQVMQNNYYKAGPVTPVRHSDRIVEPYAPYGQYYVAGNFVVGHPEVSQDNWLGVKCVRDSVYLDRIPDGIGTAKESAKNAYEKVLAGVGASLHRDAVDKRVCDEVSRGSFTYGDKGIINSQKDVGGWPLLAGGKMQKDSDKDGMPDKWERRHGLNPNDPTDATSYSISKEYPNLEVYLNEIVM